MAYTASMSVFVNLFFQLRNGEAMLIEPPLSVYFFNFQIASTNDENYTKQYTN